MERIDEKYQKRRLRQSYITSVISISMVLLLLGVQGLLVFNAQNIAKYVKENIAVSAFLKSNAEQDDIVNLQKKLKLHPNVVEVNYISKDSAAKQLTEELGEDFIKFIGTNPLSASLEIRINANYSNNDSIVIFEKMLMRQNIVKEVSYQKNLIQSINENISNISTVLLIICALMLIVVVTLINNTIRLSIYSKRLVIRSMQLVGAKKSFILKPFIKNGIMQGLIAAIIAAIIIVVVYIYGKSKAPDLMSFTTIESLFPVLTSIVIIGIVISGLSTWIAVNRFIKMNKDVVYF
ncbi:cell division protein FtsX [Bacteroidia bacterium]|nr:cell division protein FtsX [Bacteroidia bacterium]